MALPAENESTVLPAPCLPYAQATIGQRALALAGVYEALQHHFPTLSWGAWLTGLDTLQPDLWLEGPLVTLDYADLLQLTQTLAGSPELPPLDPPLYGPHCLYLARRLQEYAEGAVGALAELEANPAAYGLHTHALIRKLAAGNGVVAEVLAALTGSPVSEGRPGSSRAPELLPGSPAVVARLHALARTGHGPL